MADEENKTPKKRLNYHRLFIQWAVLLFITYAASLFFFNTKYILDAWVVLLLGGYIVSRFWFEDKRIPDFWIFIVFVGYVLTRVLVGTSVEAIENYRPFGGLQALSGSIARGTLAESMNALQILLGIILIIGILFFSKLFCGYVCPAGTVTEWLGKRGQKLGINFTIRGIPDRILRVLKYVVLFFAVYLFFESGEILTREFDPNSTIASWYGYNINLTLIGIFIGVALLFSLVIRQFWCKYLCPVGAITNILTYLFLFVVIIGIYIFFALLGWDERLNDFFTDKNMPMIATVFNKSWLIPLTILTVAGFVIESIKQKNGSFPIFKITKSKDIGDSFLVTDKACPQGIKISKEGDTIRHIDCNLCTECIVASPVRGALTVNRVKAKWIPPVIAAGLIVLTVYLAIAVELPIVEKRWAEDVLIENSKTFEKSGIKHINSAQAAQEFTEEMKKIDGVLAASVYIASHKVKVYYDPVLTSEKKIKQKMFEPAKEVLRKPESTLQFITVVNLGIENFFDQYDAFYLQKLLQKHTGIYGYETHFGEPIVLTIYYDYNQINVNQLKNLIESKKVEYFQGDKEFSAKPDFNALDINEEIITIDKIEFEKRMFDNYDARFNYHESYADSLINSYIVPLPQATNEKINKHLPVLQKHLAKNDGIIGLHTKYSAREAGAVAEIEYVEQKTTADSLYKALTSDTLIYKNKEGEIVKVKNPFIFSTKGRIKIVKTDSLTTDTVLVKPEELKDQN